MGFTAGKPIRTIGLALSCIVFGALAVPAGTAFAKTVQDVFVTNDSTQPIPTKAIGTTEVTGTVGISGQPSVNVANTPTVTVGNGANNPVATSDVNQPGRLVYQQSELFSQDPNVCTNFVCSFTFDPVPAGHRLVITYASAQFKLADGGKEPSVELTSGDDFILLPPAAPLAFDKYLSAGQVTFFVGPGQAPTMELQGQFIQPVSNTAEISISGYLVPLS
ncbi:MAG: hypothetical protein ABR600_06320 [Actinomycetota bacterium]